ncbi:hypothetical protein OUZ56_019466 [Daphnia magna]|uniref:Uncharacterized protein n=1 Tax=Daphnia magna TaxID=35525 RepID=A0ABQ9ZBN2_9CRUS|nr:hypothetical protein OUZ56_019466 [Daphnia magna]
MQPIEFVLDGSDGEAAGIEYNRVTLERDGEEKNKKSETCSSFTINFQRQHRWPTVMPFRQRLRRSVANESP